MFGPPSVVDPSGKRPIVRAAYAAPKEGPLTVAQLGPRELVVQTVVEKKGLIGGGTREESLAPLPVDVDGDVTALKLDGRGEDLFLGTSRGQIVWYSMRDRATPAKIDAVEIAAGGAPVTAMEFLIGDRTLVVGDAAGRVSSWQVVPPPQGGPARLTRIYDFTKHDAPVVALSASKRDKGFVSGDTRGGVHLNYGTSGRDAPVAPGRGRLGAVARLRAEGRRGSRGRRRGEASGSGGSTTRTPRSRSRRCSARSGTRATRRRPTCGSPRGARTTSRPSSA